MDKGNHSVKFGLSGRSIPFYLIGFHRFPAYPAKAGRVMATRRGSPSRWLGSGNSVIPDLLKLGIPRVSFGTSVRLVRQKIAASGYVLPSIGF